MEPEITVAVLALIGTLGGSFTGVLASAKLTAWRLQKLEEKVEKHNSVMERTFRLEEQMKVANQRIADLEEDKI